MQSFLFNDTTGWNQAQPLLFTHQIISKTDSQQLNTFLPGPMRMMGLSYIMHLLFSKMSPGIPYTTILSKVLFFSLGLLEEETFDNIPPKPEKSKHLCFGGFYLFQGCHLSLFRFYLPLTCHKPQVSSLWISQMALFLSLWLSQLSLNNHLSWVLKVFFPGHAVDEDIIETHNTLFPLTW